MSQLPTRRALLVQAATAALTALAGQRALAAGPLLPPPASLQDALASALAKGKALIVMSSLHGCPFCKLVRESHLAPLLSQGQPVVQLDHAGTQPSRDFLGRPATQGELLRQFDVRVHPTVLFFGRGAREVAPRLVGASIPDFYGAYLEERVLQANRSIG